MIEKFAEPEFAMAFARIECHYFMNNAFFETDNYLIENVGKIRHIPTVIVQGRYDVVCPIMSAWELHRAWPEAELRIIPDAGHSASEPGIVSALGRTVQEVVPDLWPRVEPSYRGVLAGGGPVTNQELSGETSARPPTALVALSSAIMIA